MYRDIFDIFEVESETENEYMKLVKMSFIYI